MMAGPANYDVGIVGLGYVGLTLATVLAEAGNAVIGVEKRPDIVEMTNTSMWTPWTRDDWKRLHVVPGNL